MFESHQTFVKYKIHSFANSGWQRKMLCSDKTSFVQNGFQTLLQQKFVKLCCVNAQVASLL
jgi:hypothetical protein